MIRLVFLEQFSSVFSLCCCSGHGLSSLRVLSLGNFTAPPAAVVGGAAGRGGAGRSGGGFPGIPLAITNQWHLSAAITV